MWTGKNKVFWKKESNGKYWYKNGIRVLHEGKVWNVYNGAKRIIYSGDTLKSCKCYMKLREFIETYVGFEWNNGETVVIDQVIDQRDGKSYLCRCRGGKLIHSYRDMSDWTHSENTMLITL